MWQRTYGVPGHAEIAVCTVNSYDNGFIINFNGDGANVLKADINGNILWLKKYLYYENNYIGPFSISSSHEGIIFQGGVIFEGNLFYAYIVKTNNCGEFVWCKKNIFNSENLLKFIKIKSDDQIIFVTAASSLNIMLDRFQLWEMNSDGNINWTKQVLPGTQTYFSGTEFQQMCFTSDGGSLLAGYTYYPYDTTNNPWDGILQPCLVKHDSLGNRQWVYPPISGADTNHIGFFNACVQVGNTYYAAGSNYNYGPGHFLQPLVARFDLNGNLLSYVSSGPDTMYHELTQILPATDTSILLISAANTAFGDPNYLMVFIANTLGNFNKGFIRHDLIVGQYGDEVCIMRDNKFIIPCSFPIGGISANTDIVAIKLNANLEYDSIYTQQFTYDSLCPYPIVSDTVICNCEPFVSAEEAESVTEALNIYPNPASDQIVINCRQEKPAGGVLLIYDVYGRLKYQEELSPGKSQSVINCEPWKPGLYIAKFQSGIKTKIGKVIVK